MATTSSITRRRLQLILLTRSVLRLNDVSGRFRIPDQIPHDNVRRHHRVELRSPPFPGVRACLMHEYLYNTNTGTSLGFDPKEMVDGEEVHAVRTEAKRANHLVHELCNGKRSSGLCSNRNLTACDATANLRSTLRVLNAFSRTGA